MVGAGWSMRFGPKPQISGLRVCGSCPFDRSKNRHDQDVKQIVAELKESGRAGLT